jgi:hypothetical protein
MSRWDLSFDSWVGKKIEKALIDSEHYTMYWKVDGKWYKLDAMGDCCSHSWYEHCDGGDALQDAEITSFEDVSQDPSPEEEGEYECLRINMLKFRTSKGYCTIEFRNSSNGYYSGWTDISECEDPGEVGVLGDF